MRRCFRQIAVGMLACCLSAHAASSPAWSVARSNHFEVYSQAGPASARTALDWFEQLRTFFQEQTSLSPTPPVRLRVIGFASAKEYEAYQLRTVSDAYYAGYGNDNYIVMPGLSSHQWETAAHEYVHALLHTRGAHLPLWLNEGLADVYSTVRVGEHGSTVGAVNPNRISLLRSSPRPPLGELLDLSDEQFHAATNRDAAGLFYARSWALTHMLLFAPQYHSQFAALLMALSSGEPGHVALPRLYHRPLTAVADDLEAWINQQAHFVPVPLSGVTPRPGTVTLESVSPFASRTLMADLLFTLSEFKRATALYTALAQESPGDAHALAALGNIGLRQNDFPQARQYWRQALQHGIQDATLCFQYAVLASQANLPADEIRPALERAIALRPHFDDARYQLALLEANSGHEEMAVTQLRSMDKIDPSRAYAYWCALADAYLTLNRREEAKAAARQAAEHSHTPEERAHAAQFIYLADTDLTVQVARDAAGRVQLITTRKPRNSAPWNPFIEPGDRIQRIQATLREVRCDDVTRLLVAVSTGPALLLAIPDPSRVQMRHAPPEFTCGPQPDAPAVNVEYAAAPTATEAGIVRGLEFAPPQ